MDAMACKPVACGSILAPLGTHQRLPGARRSQSSQLQESSGGMDRARVHAHGSNRAPLTVSVLPIQTIVMGANAPQSHSHGVRNRDSDRRREALPMTSRRKSEVRHVSQGDWMGGCV